MMKTAKLLLSILLCIVPLEGCAFSDSAAVSSDTIEEHAAEETENSNMHEMYIEQDGKKIYGRLYLPDSNEKPPLVILSHGFGGSYRNTEDYAEAFAENGIAAFAFDFTGGGYNSKSGGSMTEMSVLTEADDLNTVLDYFENDETIDQSKIFLFGESQGGFVSTYIAGKRRDDTAGLIVFYPAYVLQDDSRERNPDPQNGPQESSIMGMRIGRIYDVDAQSFDIYDVMKNYTGRVLIVHGASDSIVPLSYSQRAAETFPDAELKTIEGAGHGFYGSDEEEAAELAVEFVKGILDEKGQNDMKLQIDGTDVQVEWEDNDAVQALNELVQESPLTIQMSMYGGFEQVGLIGTELPSNDVETTTSPGDIVLYSGNQIVIFYGSNTWAYTRLGKLKDRSDGELREFLGNGNVTIAIEAERKE